MDVSVLAQADGGLVSLLSDRILEYGLLGVMFLLVGFALYKRDKDLTKERQERLTDAKGLLEMIEASTEARVTSTVASHELNKLAEKLVDGQQQILRAISELRK